MSYIDHAQVFLTLRELGGRLPTDDELDAELSRLPLEGTLGWLASMSIRAAHAGPHFYTPQFEADYVKWALADDFPEPLPCASHRYVPGRLPILPGPPQRRLVHEQSMAWLAHRSLLVSDAKTEAPELSHHLYSRMSRLLLIGNDWIASSDLGPGDDSLSALRRRSLEWLRLQQFNRLLAETEGEHGMLSRDAMTRHYIILKDHLPKHFGEFESLFEAACGVPLDAYFHVLEMLRGHIHMGMAYNKNGLDPEGISGEIEANRDAIFTVMRSFTWEAEEYREAWRRAGGSRGTRQEVFDFTLLRKRPLVRTPRGTVCPVFSFIKAKIKDGPYYLVNEYLKDNGDETTGTRLRVAYGKAFEDYAHGLFVRIARADMGGAWESHKSPGTKKRSELSDTYLQRANIGVAAEHKALRPDKEFLTGGLGRGSLLGPNDDALATIERGCKPAKRDDDGLFTRGLWQQDRDAPELLKWGQTRTAAKTRPTRLYAILTNLPDFRADEIVQRGYLARLIQRAGLYAGEAQVCPSWLHVSDLEWLAALAEEGKLDLRQLLEAKVTAEPCAGFDVFLHARYTHLRDPALIQRGTSIMRAMADFFFPESVRRDPDRLPAA